MKVAAEAGEEEALLRLLRRRVRYVAAVVAVVVVVVVALVAVAVAVVAATAAVAAVAVAAATATVAAVAASRFFCLFGFVRCSLLGEKGTWGKGEGRRGGVLSIMHGHGRIDQGGG